MSVVPLDTPRADYQLDLALERTGTCVRIAQRWRAEQRQKCKGYVAAHPGTPPLLTDQDKVVSFSLDFERLCAQYGMPRILLPEIGTLPPVLQDDTEWEQTRDYIVDLVAAQPEQTRRYYWHQARRHRHPSTAFDLVWDALLESRVLVVLTEGRIRLA